MELRQHIRGVIAATIQDVMLAKGLGDDVVWRITLLGKGDDINRLGPITVTGKIASGYTTEQVRRIIASYAAVLVGGGQPTERHAEFAIGGRRTELEVSGHIDGIPITVWGALDLPDPDAGRGPDPDAGHSRSEPTALTARVSQRGISSNRGVGTTVMQAMRFGANESARALSADDPDSPGPAACGPADRTRHIESLRRTVVPAGEAGTMSRPSLFVRLRRKER